MPLNCYKPLKVETPERENLQAKKTICTPGSDYIPFPSVIAGPIPTYFLTPNTCGMLVGAFNSKGSEIFPGYVTMFYQNGKQYYVNQLASVHIQNANHRNDGLECRTNDWESIFVVQCLISMMAI